MKLSPLGVMRYAVVFVAGAVAAIGFLVWDARTRSDSLAEWFEITKANYIAAQEKLKAQGYSAVYIAYEIDDGAWDCPGEEGCYWYRAMAPDGRYAEGVVRVGKKT